MAVDKQEEKREAVDNKGKGCFRRVMQPGSGQRLR
jgi:hypothetical protein